MNIKKSFKGANVCMSSVLRETIQEYMYRLGFLKKIRALQLLDNSFLHILKLRYKAHLFPFVSCISSSVVVY